MVDVPTIDIVYGPPGAGKSTVAGLLGLTNVVQPIDEARPGPAQAVHQHQRTGEGSMATAADVSLQQRRSLVFETSKGDDALAVADRAYWLGYRIQSTIVAVQDPEILIARLAGRAVVRHGEELVRTAVADLAVSVSKLVDRSDRSTLVDTSGPTPEIQARFARGALGDQTRDRKPWALAEIERVEARSLREDQAVVRPLRTDSGADSRGRRLDLESVARGAWSDPAARQAWQELERAAAPAFRNVAEVLAAARRAYQVPFRISADAADRAAATGILRGREGLLATNERKLERVTAEQASSEFRASLAGLQKALERAAEGYIREVQTQRERELVAVPALSAEARSLAVKLSGGGAVSPMHAVDRYRPQAAPLAGPLAVEIDRQWQALHARFPSDQIDLIRHASSAVDGMTREAADQLRPTLHAYSLANGEPSTLAPSMDTRSRLRLSR